MWIGNTTLEDHDPVIAYNVVQRTGGTGIAGHYAGGRITGNLIEDAGRGGASCYKRLPLEGSTAPAVIEENTVRRCGGQGMQLNRSVDVTVRGNLIETATGSGVYMIGGWTDSRFEWNVVRDSRTDVRGGFQGGILVFAADGASVVENNEFRDTRAVDSRTQDHGILFYPGPVLDLVVRYNVLRDHVESGIGTGTTTGPLERLRVYGNESGGNGAYGLRITQGGSAFAFSACGSENDFSGNAMGDVSVDIPLPACDGLPASRLGITSASALPPATVGAAWSVVPAATGGDAPYRWSVAAGTLPRGLTLDETTGEIAGTPTRAGLYHVPLYAYDAASPSQSARTELVIAVYP
jgi:hypothetical protein